MKTLAEIYERYRGNALWSDKGTIHSYIEVYSAVLEPYRQTAKKVIELGILGGHSLRMWEEYFTAAEVHGVDLCLQPLDMFDLSDMVKELTHHIWLLNAEVPDEVEKCFKDDKFDVIIDDAGHAVQQQLSVYSNFKSKLAPGGIYVIEDIEALDASRWLFEKIDPTRQVQILDRRGIKGRYDDVLVIIRDKQTLCQTTAQ